MVHTADRKRGRGGRGGGGGERPPPGLTGRDIGMWYAKRSKEKSARFEREGVCVIFCHLFHL